MSGETSIFNIGLFVFIALIVIGLIWLVASTMGSFLPAWGWLLIIGVIGLSALLFYAKHRQ